MASEPIDVRTLTPEEISGAIEWLELRPTPIFADPQKNTVLALAKAMARMLESGPVGRVRWDGTVVPLSVQASGANAYALPTPEEP